MGPTFIKQQEDIWKEGKLVEIGGMRTPGIIVKLNDIEASTINVMVNGKIINVINPFWDGDFTTLKVIHGLSWDDTVVSPIYLLDDDPYYELLMEIYKST